MSFGGFKFWIGGTDLVSPEASLNPTLVSFAYSSCCDDGAEGSVEDSVLFVILVVFSEVSDELG